eukprot:CAMPEP_0117003520 /NCGR_PEP_ID=MMETSP0472-20121206/4804_1 /TAXON_ID=693140 ORGANISM="Tiarina fusus, Strain LIS" /NCGR_SAMPLE_ID=MMETSP0472 /ASSEMBLY_ACC=CAM_ASM_000603 /LENGTH=135 /DNA_ID=CAMNT_0004704179 /DNA_START=13 /DNA_END=420 /DNA_ORIENTATION=-
MSVLLIMQDGKGPFESSIITSDSKFEIRKGALFSSSNSSGSSTDASRNPSPSIPASRQTTTMRRYSSDDNESFDTTSTTKGDDRSFGDARDSKSRRPAPLRRVYSAGEQRALRRSEQKAFAKQAANSIVHHGFYV